jgi:uncharacterized circularly permuted ATP-grasp superfamily protein
MGRPLSIQSLNASYRKHFLNRQEQIIADYQHLCRFLVEQNCTFRGDPMPTLFKPNFISPGQQKLLIRYVEMMARILSRFIYLYMNNSEIREIMGFSEQENDLFSIDPGYRNPLVISRLDAFLAGNQVKFLEFNCDSPAGIAYADIQEQGFRLFFENYPFMKQYQIGYMIRQQILLDSLLQCYREFRINRTHFPAKPVVAIVDWKGVSTYSEFELHSQYFRSNGIEAIITAPQDFTIRGGKTYALGQEVHLVYRRVITRELLERMEEAETFVESVREGLVCCCNSFRTVIAGNKKVLGVLTDKRFWSAFSRQEQALIKETIPWTTVLADTQVTYHGRKVELPGFVSANKERLVLKPSNSYGGKDVHIGRETSQAAWDLVIQNHIGDHSWVVQDLVPIPTGQYPEINEQVVFKSKYVNINPYAINGSYCGTITRVSDSQVINVSAGGGLVPTLTARKKPVQKE